MGGTETRANLPDQCSSVARFYLGIWLSAIALKAQRLIRRGPYVAGLAPYPEDY